MDDYGLKGKEREILRTARNDPVLAMHLEEFFQGIADYFAGETREEDAQDEGTDAQEAWLQGAQYAQQNELD